MLCITRISLTVFFNRVKAGREVIVQLAEMGLFETVKINVVKNNGKDPLLIQFKGTQLMIGRHLSDSIEVIAN